jgi:hypothetical protein
MGDEDFHFPVSKLMQEYLSSYLHGEIPAGPGPLVLRYPSLFYLVFALFPNLSFDSPSYGFFQRLPLAIPYFALVWATYSFTYRITKNNLYSLLMSCLTATSPVLLCYTSDKFLDIGHPILFFVGFLSLLLGVRGNRSSLAIAIWCASLMPLVRDNALPSALLLATFVAVHELVERRIVSAVIALLVGCWPGAAYYVLKSLASSVDSARLSVSNLAQQDYGLLFAFLPVYIPWAVVLLCLYSIVSLRRSSGIWMPVVILSSVGAQLAIYALFEPGWMPWSRNYLMFFGQFLALGVYALSVVPAERGQLVKVMLSMNIATNVYLNYSELNKNRIFHEVSVMYRYDQLMDFIKKNPVLVPPQAEIAMSVPVAIPLSFRIEQQGANLKPIYYADSAADWRSLMSFEEFVRRVPERHKLLLYHWRTSRALFKASGSSVSRPSNEQLGAYRILFESVDPLSDGASGFLLLESQLDRDEVGTAAP